MHDFIIVGGGAAGCVVAYNLAFHGFDVAIIESSENFNDNYNVKIPFQFVNLWGDVDYAPIDCKYFPPWNEWSFPSVSGKEPFVYDYVRGSNLGGSANHHAMIAYRGNPKVYNEWANILNDPSWAYDNLKKYFDKIQQTWLSITHTEPELFELQFLQNCINVFDIPYKKNITECPLGIGFCDFMITKDGERSSSSISLLQKILHHKNIHLYTNHLATRILFCKNKAIGVETIDGANVYKADTRYGCNTSTKLKTIKCRYEVILCAGAINTPQLLMLSGIGDEEELKKHDIPVRVNLSQVGKNLKDHPEIWVNFQLQNITHRWQVFYPFSFDSPAYDDYSEWKVGPYRYPYCSIGIEHELPNQKQLHINLFTIPSNNFNTSQWINDYDYKNSTYASFLIEVSNPDSVGILTLNSSDPTDMPNINMGLNTDNNADCIAQGVKYVETLMTSFPQYNPTRVYPDNSYNTTEELKSFFKQYSAYGHHICGTCAMGKVADSKGLVYGIKRVRICDTSLFPTIVSANPCFPLYAVAEKISADILKKYLQKC